VSESLPLAAPVRNGLAARALRLRLGPDLLAIAFVLLAMLVVLWPLAVTGELPKATDTDAFYGPFGAFLHDRLQHGDIPLWAPGAFSGQPFAADAQSGVFYPPALLAYWLLDPADALRMLALFHYAIAALATYGLVRLLGGGRVGAAYGALAYALSTHLIARASMLGLLGGVAWLPVCLLAAEAAVQARPSRRPLAVAGVAAAFACSILAGSQQITAVAALACVIWLGLRRGRVGVLLAVLGVGAGVGLAAIALLPRLELLHQSTSSSGVADPDGIGSLVPGDLRALIGPWGVSRSEITSLYAGAVTPALALVALARGGRQRAPLLALVALALVWGTGLAGWLLQPFPLVHSLASHEPVRGMALLVLCLAVLAGLALGPLAARPRALAVLALSALFALAVGRGAAFDLAYLIPLGAAAAVVLTLRRPRYAMGGAVLLLVVLAADLGWHGYQRFDWRPDSEVLPPPAPSAQFLLGRQAAEGPFRIATVAPFPILNHQLGAARSPQARALLLDQEALAVGLEDVAGYNPVHLDAYDEFMRASNGGHSVDRHFELALRAATPQLRALSVRYYVSPPGHAPAGLAVVYRDSRSVVTRDPRALPFVRLEAGGTTRAATVLDREPDRIVARTPAGGKAGRVVVADLDYPGWKVSVDGRPAKGLVADGVLRAVDVPAGAHTVEWRFEPAAIRHGALLSGLTAILLGAACLVGVLRRPTGR
jgi:hypothetical protein